MQPTLVITVPGPGMIYVNGRFLGESSPELPLLAPASPFGAVYLEYRPLEPGWLPMARKVVLSSGSPLPDVLAGDVYAIRWPGGVTEIELAPPEPSVEATESFMLDGVSFRLIRGGRGRIEIGSLTCPFPADARAPQLHRLPGIVAVTADTGGGRCVLTLSTDLSRQTGFVKADRLTLEPTGAITAITSKGDFSGHATQERWQAEPAGLRLVSSESIWLDGAPRTPSTPEETAVAAVQAALLGLFDEAEEHLSPALRSQHPMDAIPELGSACLPMKYGFPDGRPCVGLLHVETGSCASVLPIYFQAEKNSGRWLLTELSADGSQPNPS